MKMKKAICVVLAALMLGAFSGCAQPYYPEYESGYYRYAVKTDEDGSKEAYLIGFTKLGEQQTEMVYPEEIDGIPVWGFGYERKLFLAYELVGWYNTANVEKFFFPTTPKGRLQGGIGPYLDFATTIYWNENFKRTDWYFTENMIYGYNAYVSEMRQYDDMSEGLNKDRHRIANVTYLYNYENSPNGGYYWVDDYDQSVITYIPPKPKREGYVFEGWYKEAECVTAWNFEEDKTGELIKIDYAEQYDSYEGICLYAKWAVK